MSCVPSRFDFYQDLLDKKYPEITIPEETSERSFYFQIINLFYNAWATHPDLEDPIQKLTKLLLTQQIVSHLNCSGSIIFDIASRFLPLSFHMEMVPPPKFAPESKIWGNSKFQIKFVGPLTTPSNFLFLNVCSSKYKGMWTSFSVEPSEKYKINVQVANSKLKIKTLSLEYQPSSLILRFGSQRYFLYPLDIKFPSFPPIDVSSKLKVPSKIKYQLILSLHPVFCQWFRHHKIIPIPNILDVLFTDTFRFPLENN